MSYKCMMHEIRVTQHMQMGKQAAARVWPSIFLSPAAEARKGELVEKMRAVRPVVETGYVR